LIDGEQVDAVIERRMDRERPLTFEIGRRLDWLLVDQIAGDFAVSEHR